MSNRPHYLVRIQAAYAEDAGRLDAELETWRRQFRANAANNALFGYFAPKWPLHLAVVAAFLYEQTGKRSLAEEAGQIMLRYREWTSLMPPEAAALRPEYEDGIPPLDAVFDPVLFAAACERIRSTLSDETYGELAQIAADSLRPIWRFPEWGGHNRALLRAASLAASARAFADHPDAPQWLNMADELAEESWGRWSIEDAMLYQSHWLRAMILYAEARNREAELAQFIQPRMHLRAMVQLMSPLGILPDFGDSHWLMHSAWEWLSCLEWGANVYGDPSMKWAAQRIWEAQQREVPNIYAANVLTLAWRWCDDNQTAMQPGAVPDALDDLVIKKVVFRTGWDANASYACLNYRDEGDYARVARDYLRADLAVSAEKMHHGHADEGSFAMLVHDSTILLHESGYRELPPDGIYRADFYHNRLIWRPGMLLGDPKPHALQDNGHYKPVRSERLYQTRLGDAQIVRLRVTDPHEGISWDRSIFFLSDLPCWVVIDGAASQRTAPRTLANLWWTTDILAQGDNWSDTHIGQIGGWQNARTAALRILTPSVPGQTLGLQSETVRRSFQEEIVLASFWRGHHLAGRTVNFVSVLWPLPYGSSGEDAGPQVEVLESNPTGRGLGVRLLWQGEERLLTTLNDLSVGLVQEEIRPRHTFEQGKAAYGPITSDAAFVYTRRQGDRAWAGFIKGTRLDNAGVSLYSAPLQAMFQEDGTDRAGTPTRFRWESGWGKVGTGD
ncbi:MAG: hypothetical protein KF893_26270 [Caldilineaceae bacterium]|nr:hypothetical protein [Caldilineaceae bacterium]